MRKIMISLIAFACSLFIAPIFSFGEEEDALKLSSPEQISTLTRWLGTQGFSLLTQSK